MQNAKTVSKSEIAKMCNVSVGTVRRWCNVDFYEELKNLGYKKQQQIFTPCQTQFLKLNLLEYNENNYHKTPSK